MVSLSIKSKMLLSIIILNYNTKELTISCINSILKQFEKELKNEQMEIIVFDNASTDNSVQELLSIPPENFKLIKNEKNLGFSKGNNAAAKTAKGKYLLFLNSDTEVLDKGISGMVKLMEENQKIGILGAKLKNPDGTNQKSAGKFYTLFNAMVMIFGGERLGFLRFSPSRQKEVDWVSGAAFMITKEVFDNIGGFDENLFMYIEDMELCFRLRKEGYKIMFYPNVSIVHKERGSSDKTFAIVSIYKGLLYFYKKHTNLLEYGIVKTLLRIKAFAGVTIGLVSQNSNLRNRYKEAAQVLR